MTFSLHGIRLFIRYRYYQWRSGRSWWFGTNVQLYSECMILNHKYHFSLNFNEEVQISMAWCSQSIVTHTRYFETAPLISITNAIYSRHIFWIMWRGPSLLHPSLLSYKRTFSQQQQPCLHDHIMKYSSIHCIYTWNVIYIYFPHFFLVLYLSVCLSIYVYTFILTCQPIWCYAHLVFVKILWNNITLLVCLRDWKSNQVNDGDQMSELRSVNSHSYK